MLQLYVTRLRIKHPLLSELNLTKNELGDAGVTLLARALCLNSTLTSRNLSETDVGDAGETELGAALRINSSITELNLKYSRGNNAGATELAGALRVNSCLTSLDPRRLMSFVGPVLLCPLHNSGILKATALGKPRGKKNWEKI
mmetsp:Transcript_12889/g.18685  ORF Transcript_12889/g.18685 Transcript_12889/m.18685 type:complete len:144 (+) Transcript_12889:1025-1456(+)